MPVFNLEVEGLHNYFVSATPDSPAILVHNTSLTPLAREAVELAREIQQYRAWHAACDTAIRAGAQSGTVEGGLQATVNLMGQLEQLIATESMLLDYLLLCII